MIGTRVSSIDTDVSPDAGWIDGRRPVTPGTHTTAAMTAVATATPPTTRFRRRRPARCTRVLSWPSMSGVDLGDLLGQPGAQPVLTDIVNRLLLQHLGKPGTGPVQVLLHRRGRGAHHPGDLLDRAVLQVEQDHRRPLLGRQNTPIALIRSMSGTWSVSPASPTGSATGTTFSRVARRIAARTAT